MTRAGRWTPFLAALVSVSGMACPHDPQGCHNDACSQPGLVLNVWVAGVEQILASVQVHDVTAAADRARFETEIAASPPAITGTPLASAAFPFCADSLGNSAIEVPLPGLAGKTVAAVAFVRHKDCGSLMTVCPGTLGGHAFATLGDGCQGLMIPLTTP